MEWGTPVKWGRFLLFFVPQSVKTKESNPTRPGSPNHVNRPVVSTLSLALFREYGEGKHSPRQKATTDFEHVGCLFQKSEAKLT